MGKGGAIYIYICIFTNKSIYIYIYIYVYINIWYPPKTHIFAEFTDMCDVLLFISMFGILIFLASILNLKSSRVDFDKNESRLKIVWCLKKTFKKE